MLLVLAIGGAYGFYWRYVAGRLAAGLSAWTEAERLAGRDIAYSFAGVTGFPFAFRGEFRDVRLGLTLDPAFGVVSTAMLRVELNPWRLDHVAFSAPALVTLRLPQGDFTAAGMSGAVDLPPKIPIDHTHLQLGFALDFSSVGLPPGRVALTEGPIEALGLTAKIMGPLVLQPDIATGLDAWRKAGGTMEIERFLFAQAPLRLEGSGTLALDAGLQPVGAASIRAEGLGRSLDLLAAEGRLEAGPANAASLAVKALERPQDGPQEAPVAQFGLSLQDGSWWLGPLRLAPAPIFVW